MFKDQNVREDLKARMSKVIDKQIEKIETDEADFFVLRSLDEYQLRKVQAFIASFV
jgi:predicted aldo/keto reductase-like oxidoreductase